MAPEPADSAAALLAEVAAADEGWRADEALAGLRQLGDERRRPDPARLRHDMGAHAHAR